MQMEWNWMAGGSGWITLSQRELTRPPQAFTWAGQPTAEVEAEVEGLAAAVIPTTTGVMTEDMTDMKNMIIVTGGDHLHPIIVVTDHDQDLVPIAQGAIEEQKLVTVANTIFKQRVLTLAFPMDPPAVILNPIKIFGSFRMSFS